MHPEQIKTLARECGFELAGIAAAEPVREAAYYRQWVADGFAGEMRYLTDRRAALRDDPRMPADLVVENMDLGESAQDVVDNYQLHTPPRDVLTLYQYAERQRALSPVR